MRQIIILFLIAGLLPAAGFGQSATGKKNVEKLCGCFDVVFKYAETFSPDPKYKFHERDEISGGTELILPIEVSDTKLVLQHLLVISDSMIIKHWREDWTYENPEIWKYAGDKNWHKEKLPLQDIKGKWTQTVWEVSDAPRYQGAGEWVYLDGQTFWQNTTDAPLPRREYSIRSDYNILKRTNRLVLNDTGWLHEQDNRKIIRKNGSDQLLAEEKGINSYKRMDDKPCASAKKYWDNNAAYWSKVRQVWKTYLDTHPKLSLKSEVDGKPLHDHLFALAKEYAAGKLTSTAVDERIKASLESFLGHENKGVAQQ